MDRRKRKHVQEKTTKETRNMISSIIKTVENQKRKGEGRGRTHNPFPNHIFFHFVTLKKLEFRITTEETVTKLYTIIIITGCR